MPRCFSSSSTLKSANVRVGDEIENGFDTDSSAILVKKAKQSATPALRREPAKGG
jgi:hypothetical protein